MPVHHRNEPPRRWHVVPAQFISESTYSGRVSAGNTPRKDVIEMTEP